MKVSLIMLSADGERTLSVQWPDGVRVPAKGERLLLGRVGPDSIAAQSLTGLVQAVTWIIGQDCGPLGVEADLAIRLES